MGLNKDNRSSISLPSGGGAISGIGETFQPNLFSGTGTFSVPIYTSPGRDGYGPKLTLQYSSGSGNGPFGMGWQLSIPKIARKTEKSVPRYLGEDVFVLAGSEDLVPRLQNGNPVVTEGPLDGQWVKKWLYSPRTEEAFSRIEKWEVEDPAGSPPEVFWRVTTKDNVTSLFGRTASARIEAPAINGRPRIFEWLIEETFDAKGNHILYEYARDDPDLDLGRLSESARGYNQKYIRRILYGNLPGPFLDRDEFRDTLRDGHQREAPLHTIQRKYAYEVLFDYGDLILPAKGDPSFHYLRHSPGTPQEMFSNETAGSPESSQVPIRPDPFSSYRGGFELRTLRRCEGILMVHHFPELGGPTLVKATRLDYSENAHIRLSMLTAAAVHGYRVQEGRYVHQELPPISFGYSSFRPTEQRYQSLEFEGGEAPALPLSDPDTELVDLFGNGLPDIVQSSTSGFRYWRNLGGGRFGRPHPLHDSPAGIRFSDPGVTLGDAAGDGLADLLVHNGAVAGFFELAPESGWHQDSFRHYHHVPPVTFTDPNLRLVDLSGDGLADILITRDEHFVWFKSKGEDGFEKPQFVPRQNDDDAFPDVFFSDPAGRVRLADMTGDGLNDIVLIHNGRMDYWPNLGHGAFGRRVTMENSGATRIDRDFDPRRLFLADLDGTGAADLVYVGFSSVDFWFNQSGNRWSEKQTILGTPLATDTTALSFADIYGNGTTCLVWSYPHERFPGSNYKVLDFCGGEKPHLLTRYDNHMGATTQVRYAPSTRFYLEARANGTPWATALPFPVQVLDTVEVLDHISRTRLVSKFRYHHGYFDGREREFRGFGRVDQIDSETHDDFTPGGLPDPTASFENDKKDFSVPPKETRTWFHTGAWADNLVLTERYQGEFWKEDSEAFVLEDHDLVVSGATPEAVRQATRILRGAVLRTEIYGRDGTDRAGNPFSVSEATYRVIEIQPAGERRDGIFYQVPKEKLTVLYDRLPDDPRIEHEITLKTDAFGNPVSVASIAYPRRPQPGQAPHPVLQQELLFTLTRTIYNEAEATESDYRHSDLAQIINYQVTGLHPEGSQSFSRSGLNSVLEDSSRVAEIGFEETPSPDQIQLRKTDHRALVYWNDDISAPIALGRAAYHGLIYRSYQLALTPGLREERYGNRIQPGEGLKGGYLQDDPVNGTWNAPAGGDWWVPSDIRQFKPDLFFLQEMVVDPFGNRSRTRHDPYGLMAIEAVDAAGNRTRVITTNYRVLQHQEIEDPNGNRSAVAFDALGMVVATADLSEGDNLAAIVREPSNDNLASLPGGAQSLLGEATTRIMYGFARLSDNHTHPNYTHMLMRETHGMHLGPGEASRIQQHRTYTDGFGREVQVKTWAEPDDNHPGPRWRVSGLQRYNNKGKPVQEFEPWFSGELAYEPPERHGFSVTTVYDPLDRIIAVLRPERTYRKSRFAPWEQISWDENDTVLMTPSTDVDLQGPLRAFLTNFDPDDHYPETWAEEYRDRHGNQYVSWYHGSTAGLPAPVTDPESAALKAAADQAAAHADTPSRSDFDPLGRVFRVRAHNRFDGQEAFLETQTQVDIEGNVLSITDPRQVQLNQGPERSLPVRSLSYHYDTAGRKIAFESADGGLRTLFLDVRSQKLLSWNPLGTRMRMAYDTLGRPTETWVSSGETNERQVTNIQYGDDPAIANPGQFNLRGRLHRVEDESGVLTNAQYDSKGQPTVVIQEIIDDYKGDVDWHSAEPPRSQSYRTESAFDALGRLVTRQTPDGSRLFFGYNNAGLPDTIELSLFDPLSGQRDPTPTPYVQSIRYNARGDREHIAFGNGVSTGYHFEPATHRLQRMHSKRSDGTLLQDLRYTYDPVGNIIRLRDGAYQEIFNHGDRVSPENRYVYDALYRLRQATGREHEAMGACHYRKSGAKQTESITLTPQPLTNGRALLNYVQHFDYDEAGNLFEIRHRRPKAPTGTPVGWTRIQTYAQESNRIQTSQGGCSMEQPFKFTHDPAGRPIHNPVEGTPAMPQLKTLEWNHEDRLRSVVTTTRTDSVPDEGYYVYDASGRRVRKVIERGGRIAEERIYLGEMEIYRRYSGTGNLIRERHTLRVGGQDTPVARIDVLSQGTDNDQQPGSRHIRYSLPNHLGSAVLQVDENGRRISQEEFYPFGGSAFCAALNQLEVTARRYRYSGKERDDETGLYYFGERYYAEWMGSWLTADNPVATDDINLYRFVKNNPIRRRDPTGGAGGETDDTAEKESSIFSDPEYWKAAVKVGGLIGLRRAKSSIFAGLGSQEIFADETQANQLLSQGRYDEAVNVATGVEEYIDLVEKSETKGEAAALVAGEHFGFNQGVEAYTGEDREGKELSGWKRAGKGVESGIKLVSGAMEILSGVRGLRGGTGGLFGRASVKIPDFKSVKQALFQLRKKRREAFARMSRKSNQDDFGEELNNLWRKVQQEAKAIREGTFTKIKGLDKLTPQQQDALAKAHVSLSKKDLDKVLTSRGGGNLLEEGDQLLLVRPENPVQQAAVPNPDMGLPGHGPDFGNGP